PISPERGLPAWVVTEDLDFMAPAQIETAIGIVRHHEFVFDGEIKKLLVSHEVGSVRVLAGRVLQNAIFDRPTVMPLRIANMPPGGVLSIEKRAETFLLRRQSSEGRDTNQRERRQDFHWDPLLGCEGGFDRRGYLGRIRRSFWLESFDDFSI